MLSSCTNRINYLKNHYFNQGESLPNNYQKVHNYLFNVRLYDQFKTLGIFDILWLSDDIRRAYASTYCAKHNLNKNDCEYLSQEQLSLNENHISFYILASKDMHKKIKIFAQNGTAENAAWALSLLFDNQEYFPTEIKTVDLPLEYILFFKDRYNRYQKYFLVSFAIPQARKKLSRANQQLKLVISSDQQKAVINIIK